MDDDERKTPAQQVCFKIIDMLTGLLGAIENKPASLISELISKADSEIYSMFFFLQRHYPAEQESALGDRLADLVFSLGR